MNVLTQDDWDHAAQLLNCPSTRVQAVTQVESSGSGFDSTGAPTILFEALKFHKLTGGVWDRLNPTISSATWDRSLYSRGPDADARNAGEWQRLTLARTRNLSAANMSTSWGMFQIMGENYHACGFDTLPDFVDAMTNGGQAAHLSAFVEFVLASHRLADAIVSGDPVAFAGAYNGPGYAANHYDTKLTEAGF